MVDGSVDFEPAVVDMGGVSVLVIVEDNIVVVLSIEEPCEVAVEGMVEESWVVWTTMVDTGGSADVVIVDDDCVVLPSVVDSGEVAVDVMVDVEPTVLDSAESAVVVITDVGCDVGLSDIDSNEVAVLVMVDGGVGPDISSATENIHFPGMLTLLCVEATLEMSKLFDSGNE